jgi:hypothetical protein
MWEKAEEAPRFSQCESAVLTVLKSHSA